MVDFDKNVNFLQFLVIKTLYPDRYSALNAVYGSGSVSNEYRFETLT